MAPQYLSDALGSYPDREEYQVGRVIVWVKIPLSGGRATWLERANAKFEEIWQAIPAVVSLAQEESRALIPELWAAHDLADTAGQQLAVWGIWIDPATNSAEYQVGSNHDFNRPPDLPELPDGHSIMIARDSGGELRVRH